MVKALWQASDYAAQACGDVGGKADKRLSSNVDHRLLMESSRMSLKETLSQDAC
jgi:hypothetical protein